MSRNIKLTLRYDGSSFHGWQYQPNCISVEQVLKQACKQILGEDVKLQSCSRTDAGVHANMFCCNFHTQNARSNEKLLLGLNAVLPPSVAVYEAEDVSEDFHARYSCKGKEYIYKIWNEKYRNPFYEKYALHYPYELDTEEMNNQAKDFIGTHDFSAFCASGCTVKSMVRTIYSASVMQENDLIVFHVHGDGFLYNMVRIMVGTLLDINSGRIDKGSISYIIGSGSREKAGITAPACGLYLNKVFYE